MGIPASEPAFGLFFDLRNPEPWSRPWPEFLARSLEIARRVKELDEGTARTVPWSEVQRQLREPRAR